MYIVLFEDCSMIPIQIKPRKQDYKQGSRFFEVNDDKNLAWLSHWYAKGNKLEGFTELVNA
jgi:hypothetical protein